MNFNKIRVFSDFDGTITNIDLGDEIFRALGKFEPYNTRLKEGKLRIREYWKILAESIKGIPEKDIFDIIDQAGVDPYFKSFAEFCKTKGIELTIVSDGFDIYIRRIMKRLGLENLNVYCNTMNFVKETGNYEPLFNWADESCNCLCASCKRNSVISNAGEEDIIVFIGDGYSDFCAAEHSDIIFAKKNLAAYCNEHKLPHYPFSSFFDVLRILKEIIPAKNKARQRNQAFIKRKHAFEGE